MRIPETAEKGLHFLKITLSSPFGESETESSFQLIKEETKNQIIIKFSLFDINVEIPDDYKTIAPGDELLSSIKLVNLGSEGRVDVFLDYEIRDKAENVLSKKKETVAVETQANFVRIFDIPENTSPGKYTLHAKITYGDGKFAEGQNEFEIASKSFFSGFSITHYIILICVILIILISVLVYFFKPKVETLIEKIKIRGKVHKMVEEKLKKNKKELINV